MILKKKMIVFRDKVGIVLYKILMARWEHVMLGLAYHYYMQRCKPSMGTGMYEELTLVSGHICNGLFSIGEDGVGTRRMTSFCKLFGRYQEPERNFF